MGSLHWRDHLANLLVAKFKNQPVYGVEHGVWKAKTSRRILDALPMCQLYGVDTYDPESYGEFSLEPMLQEPREVWEDAKKQALQLAETSKRFFLIEDLYKPSVLVQVEPLPEYVDFVFIDGNHSTVIRDSKQYWDYLFPGGLMLWHDYGNLSEHTLGVKPAVDEFCNTHSLEVTVIPYTTIAWTHKPK